MERTGIRTEERTGLAVAVVLHLALLGMLFVQGLFPANVIDPPQRMTVSLAEDVGMAATAPDPVAESRASTAPTMDMNPAPSPQQDAATPQEAQRPTPPAPTQAQSSASTNDTRPRRRPDPRTQAQPQSSQRSGGSRLGDNFLEGSGDSTRTNETRAPASQIGASTKASLFQAVARQLRPHWQPPSGPEVEKIVTKVRFRLNPDGSLRGAPSVAGQRGVNATNQAQAGRHGEQAIRAVQLAAPFDLPEEYYEAWKTVTVDFDWRLAQ